ncbi:MAG: replicative DNA helicase [Erysipelotrichaceae bacterium]
MKLVPQSIEAERSLLGTVIVYPETVQTCYERGLFADDFYNAAHQSIFRVVLELYDEKKSTDLTSVIERLKDKNLINDIGGINYLSDLTDAVVSGYSIDHYIELIQDKSILRKLIKASQDIIQESFDNSYDSNEVMDKAEKMILNITHSRRAGDFQVTSDVVRNVIDKTKALSEGQQKVTGIKTNFNHLDNVTHGFQNGDLIILAARPSVGKTAFSLNLASNAAEINEKPVAFFSLEMPADSLVIRILAMQSGLDISNIRSGQVKSPQDWRSLTEAASIVRRLPLYIDDSSMIRVSELFAKCRKLKHDKGLGMVVVDYLQLLSGSKNAESRLQEVSEISRSLKALARELNVPVIALSQLSRSVEQRGGKTAGKPMLSDLRESGSIEQDADLVIFLSRDSETENDDNPNIVVDIAKHRNGAVTNVMMAFDRSSNAFMDIDNRFE